ncbi:MULTISPECIES: cytidine deaminase [Sphingomonadaceae]|uniref:cytidine deaminase n=2 Tax=Sphingomonadales TaxID=204457 RepID=UPI00027C9720|nr:MULTISPECIES: cytidine deaminase [Sphingomonadaceae]EJU13575.1 cytidine deaminase [Sphingomonas sp. LH128]GLK43292.1 cytidine deaminase [Novosphingobium resinovorum]
MTTGMNDDTRDTLMAAARKAAAGAYAPYSNFHVGAALLLADGTVVTGANVENASYGLSLCAETVAIAGILAKGDRPQLQALAVTGGAPGAAGQGPQVTPCGRCRQIINEIAQLGGTDPVVWCDGAEGVLETRLSELLPYAFGPANLG